MAQSPINVAAETLETYESVFKDNKIDKSEREKRILDLVKKADLAGEITKIEILDPSEVVGINLER